MVFGGLCEYALILFIKFGNKKLVCRKNSDQTKSNNIGCDIDTPEIEVISKIQPINQQVDLSEAIEENRKGVNNIDQSTSTLLKTIDSCSLVLFPLTMVICNYMYWFLYEGEQHKYNFQ